MYISRKIEPLIIENINKGKVIIILGPRRVGKTKLTERITELVNEPFIYINGDDIPSNQLIMDRSIEKYRDLFSTKKFLIVDEAQKIEDIGTKLKLMIDHISNIKIIATGSSSFDLQSNTGEPLTGRKISYELLPIAQCELNEIEDPVQINSRLENRLIYGSYPEIILMSDNDSRQKYLHELIGSYLLKDILSLDRIKNSNKIFSILQLLAFQVGSLVSLNEVAANVKLDNKTVERYIDLLTKVYVIQKIPGFSRNMRKEITKMNKYYFYDNGIRNAIINNFNPLNLRNDAGQLWENYIMTERTKYKLYNNIFSYNYFWRTYDKQEIDLIEDRNGKLYAYEIKFTGSKNKIPSGFAAAYPEAEYNIINKDNYLKFIS